MIREATLINNFLNYIRFNSQIRGPGGIMSLAADVLTSGTSDAAVVTAEPISVLDNGHVEAKKPEKRNPNI